MRNTGLNSDAWLAEDGWWSERARSRPLLWPVGADWFINDPLGPMPHTHPDASEIFFVASGEMILTVGRNEHRVGEGSLVLIPPGTFHEPLAVGDIDLCLLAVVAPNWRESRWKIEGFTEDDFARDAVISSVFSDVAMPGDINLGCVVETLGANTNSDWLKTTNFDVLLYAIDFPMNVDAHHLSGILRAGEYIHVMAGGRYRVGNTGPKELKYLTVRATASN